MRKASGVEQERVRHLSVGGEQINAHPLSYSGSQQPSPLHDMHQCYTYCVTRTSALASTAEAALLALLRATPLPTASAPCRPTDTALQGNDTERSGGEGGGGQEGCSAVQGRQGGSQVRQQPQLLSSCHT